jgi:hypothetical protein
MQKVYADSQLGYTETEEFDLPKDFNPCESMLIEDSEADPMKVPSVEPVDEIFE